MIKDKLQNFVNRRIERAYMDLDGNSPNLVDFSKLVNYSDERFQQSYILKYFYAYFLDYFETYRFLLKMNFIKESYKVLSIGAGSAIDYYGLVFALLEKNKKEKLSKDVLHYIGIDESKWLYTKELGNSNFKIINTNIDKLTNKEFHGLDFNIIIFPKSIGDFSNKEFKGLLDLFLGTSFTQNEFFIISANTGSIREIDRYKKVINLFRKKSYSSLDNENDNLWDWDYDSLLEIHDIKYPPKILSQLNNFNFSPMLKPKYLYTQIVRMQKDVK